MIQGGVLCLPHLRHRSLIERGSPLGLLESRFLLRWALLSTLVTGAGVPGFWVAFIDGADSKGHVVPVLAVHRLSDIEEIALPSASTWDIDISVISPILFNCWFSITSLSLYVYPSLCVVVAVWEPVSRN
jgi:hypothetical protein